MKMEFTASTPIRTVLVLIAMEAEAQPFIEKMHLIEQPSLPLTGPCKAFMANVGNLTVIAVTNGKCSRYSVDNVSML